MANKQIKKLKNFQNKIHQKINNINFDRYKIHQKINNINFDRSKIIESLKKKTKLNGSFTSFNPGELINNLQDKVGNLATISDNSEVVLQPARYWSQAITWVLIGTTTFAFGWITIAKTDEIVIAVGKLEPKGGVIDVQMPLEGIAREILVKEGDLVKKGDVLIRLDTEITEAQNQALKNNLEINEKIIGKLANLVKEGAVSEIQYLTQQQKVEDIKSQIKTNLVKLKYQEISAPANGIIFELQPKGPGYVARASQPVLKIVPTANLVAKVEIESRTIGFVKTGKKAEISIDSFPASDYGVIDGVVTKIGSDALPPDPGLGKGYRFPAEIKLNNQYLEVKSGKRLGLQAGMSLNANIKLRKITYLQLFLNKFSDKTNSLKSI